MASTPRRRHHCHHDHQPRTHRARAHRADGRLEDSLECYTLMNFLLIGLRYGGLSVPRSKYIIGCHVMSAHDVGGAIAACSNCTYSTHTVLMSVIIRPPAFCTLSQSAARTSASSQQLLQLYQYASIYYALAALLDYSTSPRPRTELTTGRRPSHAASTRCDHAQALPAVVVGSAC